MPSLADLAPQLVATVRAGRHPRLSLVNNQLFLLSEMGWWQGKPGGPIQKMDTGKRQRFFKGHVQYSSIHGLMLGPVGGLHQVKLNAPPKNANWIDDGP